MNRKPLRVAVLGAGTVGGEVVRALCTRPDRLAPADGAALALAGIAVRDARRARGAGIPTELLTEAAGDLVASPEIDVVVELMGGDEPARTLIAAALDAGKPVVTANKHVIAHHGAAFETIARRSGIPLRFEGSVCGGIPVLGVLAADLAGNEVRRVRGIVNGTTNHILSAMARDGRPYRDVLADAQSRGYAEADPSGDVEGDDAVNKLVILSRLAFGQWLDPASVVRRPPSVRGEGRPGITGIRDAELVGAASLGLTIKLLATATATANRAGDGVAAAVIPTAVDAAGPIGSVDGVTNRVEIDADPVGTISLAGPGAGGGPTSSAVLGDLIAIARGAGSTWAGLPRGRPQTDDALDTLGGVRRWFAFIPEGPLDALPPTVSARCIVPGSGIAVLTDPMYLPDARRAFASVLPAAVDVPLYPVDG